MKYRLYNQMWGYVVTTDNNGVVISTNSYPNNREHWSVGCSMDWLRKYYYRDETKETEIDKLSHVFIEELK
jgi:hypothetical protein